MEQAFDYLDAPVAFCLSADAIMKIWKRWRIADVPKKNHPGDWFVIYRYRRI